MEFFLVIIILIVLVKILGVSDELIVLGILGFIELIIILMVLMFAYFCIRLTFSKMKKASFTRIEKPENGYFKVAYYKIDEIEYPCVFPSEMILNDQMYRPDKVYTVMFNKRMKKVFDIWSILTCILGFICSIFAVIGTVWILNIAQFI